MLSRVRQLGIESLSRVFSQVSLVEGVSLAISPKSFEGVVQELRMDDIVEVTLFESARTNGY